MGDQVVLSAVCKVYGCGFPTWEGAAFIAAGTTGIIGATNVPYVRTKDGRDKSFCCVDFPADTPLLDYSGRPVEYENAHSNEFRCAVDPEELV